MSRRRGVTLIELLIAVTLLSVLSVGILMALRVGINAMYKANAKLMANRRAASAQRILESQIAGLMPETADCAVSADVPRVRVPFFEGQPQSMRFVSSYSLEEAERGYPRILEFQVIPGENNRGVRLIVNESLYSGSQSTGASCVGLVSEGGIRLSVGQFRPIEVGPRSFVLADRLAYCRFFFREPARPPRPEGWVAVWRMPLWPTAVRIEMAPLEPDPSRVPLVSITAPVRVQKDPYAPYAD